MTEYVTIEGVEIVSAGRAWRGQTGEYYITAEHLADAVAAQDDPLIRAPRVKLGHYDKLFGALPGGWDPVADATDGEPGFGTLTNLRLEAGGAKIVADLTEVPGWLAAAMPSAYPTRSVEWVWNHATTGDRHYSMVLTDLALGGVWEPAVEDIADITREQATAALQALLERGPEAAAAALGLDPAAAASRPQENPRMPEQPSASVSADRIGHVFNWEWAMDPDSVDGVDTRWWWCRDIRVDPDEVIASDDEGNTWRVPFTTDGEHAVTFGEPVEVRETYVDIAAPAAAASAAQARHGQRVLAHDLPKPDKSNPAAAAATNQETSTMDVENTILARRLGLPEDASEDQITEALNTEPAAGSEDVVPAAEVERRVEDAVAAARQEDAAAAAAAGGSDDRVAQIDRAQLTQLQADAAAGREARQQQLAAALDTDVDNAVHDGRIASASRDSWRQAIDPGPSPDAAATSRATAERQRLTALEPNRIPVDERGAAAAADETAGGSLPDGPLPENVSLLTPAERAQRAA